METVEATSFAVRAWRGFRRCFWQSTEERQIAPEWWVVVLNWVLACLLLSLVVWFAFASLRFNWNWGAVSSYAGFFLRGWVVTIGVLSVVLGVGSALWMVAAVAQRWGVFSLL